MRIVDDTMALWSLEWNQILDIQFYEGDHSFIKVDLVILAGACYHVWRILEADISHLRIRLFLETRLM
jgi:hypothetical protein